MTRVLIAGGGVGGLALALMLHQRGIASTVFEAAAEVKPLGVGINTLPHGIAELEALGLLPEMDRIAIRTRELRYLNHLGQTIWSDPRGTFAGHAMPQFSVHRGRLHGMLWDVAQQRLPAGTLQPGKRLTGFAQDARGVTARFADGSEARGEVLVGADGIHSALRALLHPEDGGIRWNGIQMWRGALDWPVFETGDVMLIAGDATAKLVFYPIAAGRRKTTRLTNWVIYARAGDPTQPPPRREDWSRLGKLTEVLKYARRLKLPQLDVEAMIRATGEFYEYPMCDRDPLPWWSQGRITLLGDAAHPMYPVGSNGASQALLDARCLADALATHKPAKALKLYQAERLPKTAAVVASNRLGGPERVVDLVAQRAPKGFTDLAAVASREELAAIAGGYAQLAGFAIRRAPAEGEVRVERRGDVAWLIIDRGAKLNTLTPPLMQGFIAAAGKLAKDQALRAVVVTGAGEKAFVGGADILTMAGLEDGKAARGFIKLVHGCCHALRKLPVPVLARVNGYCLGAGLELAAAADLRIGAEHAMFGMPEVRVGIPSVVEAALLPGLIGWGRTRRLLLLAETLTAATMAEWGFLERVVPAAELDQATEEWLALLRQAGPQAIRRQKALIRAWEDLPLSEAVAAGVDAFAAAWDTAEPSAMLGAFAKRRG
jgi:enoyl-CoA hydratase/carnithine racemase/2-polyprenyl-6-methoxyphenol hydroxylase-like FAD-dependent oxidoreductase